MNVVHIFDEAAARFPQRTALAWGSPEREQTISFAALAERSRRLATLLHQQGLRPGDAIVVFLPMGGPLYEVMAAVLRLGMIAVFVEPSAWRDTLDRAVANLPVRGFVGTPRACLLRWFIPALRRIPHAFSVGAALPGALSLHAADRLAPLPAAEACSSQDTALLTFTSGSTGRPKGVLRSHGMLTATHHILVRHLDIQPGDVQLATLPFFVFAHLGAGATSVIPSLDVRSPATAAPTPIVRQVRAWNVTGMVASPYLMQRVAECAMQQSEELSSLRRVFTGGAPVVPALLDAIAEAAPQARVGALYGATEAEPIALVDRDDYAACERAATAAGGGILAGRPIEELSLRVLAALWGEPRGPLSAQAFHAQQVEAGNAGEIVVAGSHVSQGYLGGEGDRENKIAVDGTVWHRTGDAGYLDASDRIWLVGRCAAKLASEAGTLYPLRVEAALAGTPGLTRGTLVEHAGRRLLILQPRTGERSLDLGEVLARVAWSNADEVVLMPDIPLDRRHHAKIDYPALLALLERRQWQARMPASSGAQP